MNVLWTAVCRPLPRWQSAIPIKECSLGACIQCILSAIGQPGAVHTAPTMKDRLGQVVQSYFVHDCCLSNVDWSSSESSDDDCRAPSMQPAARVGVRSSDTASTCENSLSVDESPALKMGSPQAARNSAHRDNEHDAQPHESCSSGDDAANHSASEAAALVLGEDEQFVLPGHISSRLYKHQIDGVVWLFSLYALKRGGILGDDMGLGKTLQCSAFIAGLLNSKLVR